MSQASLVAHFNQQFHQADWAAAHIPFALEEGKVVASFYGMRLESAFESILDLSDQVIGYQAQLSAFSPRGAGVSPRAPYAVALDEDSIVYLDRLIRTLHLLNAVGEGLTGRLFLEVHSRHIAQIPQNHGAVFESLLRDCGRSPGDIVLETTEPVFQEARHTQQAIANFQARGFSVALSQRGAHSQELDHLLTLGPNIIKLSRQSWLAAEVSAEAGRELAERVQQIKRQGVQVFLQGVTSRYQARMAHWVGADGYQDSIRYPVEETTVILVPGLGDSGPDHWQSRWGRAHPAYLRVRQDNWHQPEVTAWVETLDREIRRASSPVILVGHSLGCIAIAEWAQRAWADIRGALLAAPADVDQRPFFDTTPLRPLPFPSVLVASDNDPYLAPERARQFAEHWGSRLVNLGPVGHLNVDSGFGPWPEGEALLDELRAEALRAPSESLARAVCAARPVLAESI